jgi:hypothetical protein
MTPEGISPLKQDILSIVEGHEGCLVITVRKFLARSKYPTIKMDDIMKGRDGVNRAILELKREGYLREKNYRFLFTTEKWKQYCRGGKDV